MSTPPATSTGVRRYLRVGDADVHLRVFGRTGTTLLVVSDEPGAHATERAAVGALRDQGWCPVVVDLPGIGDTIGSHALPATEAAALLLAVADSLGATSFGVLTFGYAAAVVEPLRALADSRLEVAMHRRVPMAELWSDHRDALIRLRQLLEPRRDGAHLLVAWDHVRMRRIFSTWQRRGVEDRTTEPIPNGHDLHEAVLPILAAPALYVDALERLVDAHSNTLHSNTRHSINPSKSPPAPSPGIDRPARTFVDTPSGQVHVRLFGRRSERPPLLLLHPSPGSAASYEAVGAEFARDRLVIAPDMIGNGLSEKPKHDAMRTIDMYADDAEAVLDALNVDECDVWGTHTGALVAVELAIHHPARVCGLGVDGITLFDDDETADVLANYLPPFELDDYGSHLARAWGMRHDMSLFWPWYRHDGTGVRELGALDPDALHAITVELLRSGPTFRLAYSAAFRYPTRQQLPKVLVPMLLSSNPADPLRVHLAEAKRLKPDLALIDTFGFGEGLAATVGAFDTWYAHL